MIKYPILIIALLIALAGCRQSATKAALTRSTEDSVSAKEPVRGPFNCDTMTTNYDWTPCCYQAYLFADSCLKDHYNKLLHQLDLKIGDLNDEVKSLSKSAEDFEYRKSDLEHFKKLKRVIMASQGDWLKLRETNAAATAMNCEGGHECKGIELEERTKETYDRIEKLKEFYYLEN